MLFMPNNLKGVFVMAEAATKLPIKTDTTPAPQITKASDWQPFEALRNQVDRLFHDFQTGFLQAPSYRSLLDIEPFWRRDFGFNVTPAIDIVEKDKAFEVTAELPDCWPRRITLDR
jgi:HSP20 family protein